jgi:hypothetical protein
MVARFTIDPVVFMLIAGGGAVLAIIYICRDIISPLLNKPHVRVYYGPRASGKTIEMVRYAAERGLHYKPIQWHQVRHDSTTSILSHVVNNHLFIDEYTGINDPLCNNWIEAFSVAYNITIVMASQDEPFTPLPESFKAIPCTYKREVSHG